MKEPTLKILKSLMCIFLWTFKNSWNISCVKWIWIARGNRNQTPAIKAKLI